ncbi:MAG TPA: VOC family protein [Polyangiaceae bacterium]|jgi:catechol 2,3-dioxygenase-like lactoylglutathione lyase family enzyme
MFKQANVTLLVSDMKRSIAFYRDVLGFQVAGEYGGEFAEIDAPGVRIGLHPGGKAPLTPHARHMSIGLQVGDLDAPSAELEKRGLKLGDRVPDPGLAIRNFTDPDGHPFYLVEVKWG